jgi:stage II sporulation protein AA (anti-sigma F factor antagonist)
VREQSPPEPGPRVAGSPDQLRVHLEERDGTATLRLHGELDLLTQGQLRDQVEAIDYDRVREIVVDLHHLTFIDSSGLRLVIDLWERSRKDGFELRLLPGPPNVQRLFALTGLDGVLPIGPEPPLGENGAKGS